MAKRKFKPVHPGLEKDFLGRPRARAVRVGIVDIPRELFFTAMVGS